jgi:hypothetical protein
MGWFFAGAILSTLSLRGIPETMPDILEFVGAGIFSAAFVITLAIYRCPACDRYISRFRPDKTKCAHCGVRIR